MKKKNSLTQVVLWILLAILTGLICWGISYSACWVLDSMDVDGESARDFLAVTSLGIAGFGFAVAAMIAPIFIITEKALEID